MEPPRVSKSGKLGPEPTNDSTTTAVAVPNRNPKSFDPGPALPRLAYTMKETAFVLGVSYITVHRLVKRGQLKSSRALRHKLIPVSEIEKFLKSTLQ